MSENRENERIPRSARGRRNRFFEAEGVDELLSMVLELTAEVSTLRERLYVTERVLEQHGLAVSEDIEAYRYSAEDETRMAAERGRLLQTVLRTLESPPGDPGDGERNERTSDSERTRVA